MSRRARVQSFCVALVAALLIAVPSAQQAVGGVLEGDGIVSPAFRGVQRAPYIELTATPATGSRLFHTTFIRRERS